MSRLTPSPLPVFSDASQCIPAISNTAGYPTILLPLSFVIIVDGVFAALEVRTWGQRQGEISLV